MSCSNNFCYWSIIAYWNDLSLRTNCLTIPYWPHGGPWGISYWPLGCHWAITYWPLFSPWSITCHRALSYPWPFTYRSFTSWGISCIVCCKYWAWGVSRH